MARITFSTLYNHSMRDMQRNANILSKKNEELFTQQKVNRPSDNPVGFTNILRYGNTIDSLKQKQINMNDGGIFMTIMETTHESMNNIFTRCQALAVDAASDTKNHDDRLFTNLEVRTNLEQLVALAQTKHKDNYMFTGKWTNQPPYELKNGTADFRNNYPNTNTPIPPVVVNPLPVNPGDPRPFEGTASVTLQIFDANYRDPGLSPVAGDPLAQAPLVQRIVPGSVELGGGLLETPYKNTDLPTDHPDYDKPDYEIDYVNGTITLLSERAKAAFFDENNGDFRADAPNMDFEYVYRNSIDMTGEIYREIDSGITMKINANPDDLFGKGGYNDTDAFKEMISLMQGLWHNKQPEIANGIETVDAARKRNLAEQAIEGARQNRIELVSDHAEYLETTNTKAMGNIQDVDLAEALTQLSMAQLVYDTSLYTASSLLQRTLMDYL
jgi:flagellin-like hook-associated protein FlgL